MRSSSPKPKAGCIWLLFAIALGSSLAAHSQNLPAYTLQAQSNLALIDVFAVDHNTLVPDKTLTRADFKVLDDGKPAAIVSFDRSSDAALRPVLLWLVVQCNMKGWQEEGSGFMAGNAQALSAGLTHLHANEKVAVVHWCDTGDRVVDLAPTTNHEQAIITLDRVLKPVASKPAVSRTGELALQAIIRLTQKVSREQAPGFIPVLLFLHGDKTGAPPAEIEKLLVETLESSSILFLLNDGAEASWNMALPGLERSHVLRYLSEHTGGAEMVVQDPKQHPLAYTEVLAAILDRLHERYQLGIVPAKLDSQVHAVKVELTREAKRNHHGIFLDSRSSYLAPSQPSRGVR